MSKRSSRKKRSLERAYPPGGAMMYLSPQQLQSIQGQTFYGSKASIPVGQTALFSPGEPLPAQSGLNPGGLPIIWKFPPAYNSFPVDRSLGAQDVPSFEQLKRLATMDYGVALCERYWLDMVPKMALKISLSPEAIEGGAVEKDYVKEKTYFQNWFSKPDGNEHLHSWIRRALINQSRYDGLYIYKNKARGGKLLGLEIIDPAQMKPLLDDWGRVPQPPKFAYQQYPWGIPGWRYSTDQMIYYRETPADDTPYGLSRVERVIFTTNLALRKQKQDMAHYTEGNIPAGLLMPPEGSNWTPDQLDAYEQSWNALMAGNLQQLARIKVTQPGFTYTPFVQPNFDSVIDRFWLNIRTAAYGITPADLGFTESVNKSSGETQQDVTYARTIGPLATIYAYFLTDSMHTDFPPELHGNLFVASFSGYDAQEDEQTKATALTLYTGAGILGLSNAAKIANLPEDPNAAHIGRVIMTANGPIFLDDVADPALRAAQKQAQLAGFQLAAQNPGGQKQADESEDEEENNPNGTTPKSAGQEDQNQEKPPQKSDTEGNTKPPQQKTAKRVADSLEENEDTDDSTQALQRADFKRWREIAVKDIKAGKQIRQFVSHVIPDTVHAQLSQALERCVTVDDVRSSFKAVQEERESSFLAGAAVNGGHLQTSRLLWRNVSLIASGRS